jgi:hypothetical protein
MTPYQQYNKEMDRIGAERRRLDAEEAAARQRWMNAVKNCKHVWVGQSSVGLLKVCSECNAQG